MKTILKIAQESSSTTTKKTGPAQKMKMPGQKEKTESAISPDAPAPDPGMQGNAHNQTPTPFANAHKQVVPKVPTAGTKQNNNGS